MKKKSKDNQLLVDDFMADKYVEYSKYVIESRAISNLVDGLKTSQRKVLEKAYQIWKNDKGDMKQMKVFQFGGQVASDCLSYDSEILLSTGDTIKIGDWFHKYPDVSLDVVCIDNTGNITTSIGFSPKIALQTDVYEITTEDGKIHNMSGNHLVMLIDGTYKKASDLNENDELKSVL